MKALFAALALLTATGVAGAQTTPPTTTPASTSSAPQAQSPAGRRGQRAAQQGAPSPAVALNTVQTMLDGYVLKQAQPALQLTDTQWVAFFPKMDALQKLRREHQRIHNQLINQLNQAAPPPRADVGAADEATIAARIKAVDDAEAQMVTDERAALAAVDSVLTVYQRARFRVFEENMEKEKIRLIGIVMANPGNNPPAAVPAPGKRGGGHR